MENNPNEPENEAPAAPKRKRKSLQDKRAQLEAELRKVAEQEERERQKRLRTPEGRMENLEGIVMGLACTVEQMAQRSAQPPFGSEVLRAPQYEHQGTPPNNLPMAHQDPQTLRWCCQPAEKDARTIGWWQRGQPALRQAWQLSKGNPTPEAMLGVIKSLGELYANAFRNLAGEEPTFGNGPVRPPSPPGKYDAEEEALWRRGG